MSEDLIAEKKEKLQQGKPQVDIIDLLIADGTLSDELLRHNIWTFFAAGHQTATQALSWTVYFLALYPEIQQRVRTEVMGVLGNDSLAHSHLAQLSYLSI